MNPSSNISTSISQSEAILSTFVGQTMTVLKNRHGTNVPRRTKRAILKQAGRKGGRFEAKSAISFFPIRPFSVISFCSADGGTIHWVRARSFLHFRGVQRTEKRRRDNEAGVPTEYSANRRNMAQKRLDRNGCGETVTEQARNELWDIF